jgi:hypothetical protein
MSITEQLRAIMDKVKPLPPKPCLLMHPDTLDVLLRNAEFSRYYFDGFCTVRTMKLLDKTRKRVVFPKHPFVEYEPKDARWAVPLGIAKEVEEPLIYQIDERLLEPPEMPLVFSDWRARTT